MPCSATVRVWPATCSVAALPSSSVTTTGVPGPRGGNLGLCVVVAAAGAAATARVSRPLSASGGGAGHGARLSPMRDVRVKTRSDDADERGADPVGGARAAVPEPGRQAVLLGLGGLV